MNISNVLEANNKHQSNTTSDSHDVFNIRYSHCEEFRIIHRKIIMLDSLLMKSTDL